MLGSRLQPASSATRANREIGTRRAKKSSSMRFIGILPNLILLQRSLVGGDWSLRDIATQLRSYLTDEEQEALSCGFNVLAVSEGSRNANERTIAAVVTDGVGNLIKLGPIFAGHGPIVCLVPVEYQPALGILGDQVLVGGERSDAGCLDFPLPRLNGEPAMARQAVLGRVKSVTGTLRSEIGYEQVHVRSSVLGP